MAAHQDDKPSAAHIENVPSSNTSGENIHYSENDVNEEIVRHLQTTGEDVGMTCTCN